MRLTVGRCILVEIPQDFTAAEQDEVFKAVKYVVNENFTTKQALPIRVTKVM